ncbi:uncharacterized protein BDV14DRAFT_196680 [Aspergillus stella-maris]|uniref:uncharacterized protein n=1 Tax=Aspergillus stella-maris TaxID=1810926 RepID=UPI003CCE3509
MDSPNYILQIRASIKSSQPAEVFHSPEKFFDSVSFWKQAYEKSEAEQSKLQDRIFELEQRNHELAEKLRLRDNVKVEELQGGATASDKLKRPATTNNASRKRPKTQLDHTGYAAFAGVRSYLDDAIGQLSDTRNRSFIRHIYSLRKTLQKRSTDARIIQDAVALCESCEHEVASVIPETVSKDKSKIIMPTESQMSHLGLALHGTESATVLLLQALKKLSKPGGNGRGTKLLTYHIVCLYGAIINSLGRYCKAVAAPVAPTALSGEQYTMQTRSKTTKRTKPSGGSDKGSEIQNEGAIQLTSLLHRMLAKLDLSHTEHRQLLEGFLYTLLNRAGKTLCHFVFQDLRLQTELRAVPEGLPLPTGLIDAKLDDKSFGGAQMDAVYLVWLLRKALAVLDVQPSSPDAASSTQTEFISSIKARLQSTLVQAVFGEDSSLGRTLERPGKPESREIERLLERSTQKSSIPEWYIQEVWDLLGWDILRENNGL